MVRAERGADRPDADVLGAAVGSHERNHLVPNVLVVLVLHPASMKRMRAAVRERVAVVDVDAVQLDAPGFDRIAEPVDHALPIELPLVAAAGREHDHRRPPASVDDDAELAAEAVGIPAVIVAPHDAILTR